MSVTQPLHPYLDHPGVLAFAHRGDSDAAPENTHAAFASAAALGFRYFETDVHLSRDGVLLAFHDPVLDRVTDGAGQLEQLDIAQIKKIRVGGREAIPLMSELFEAFPEVRFNIEPKSDASVQPLIALIRDIGAEERVCVGSFNGRRIAAVREALPRVCISSGPAEVAAARLASYGLPMPALRADCLQVPTHHFGLPVADARFIAHARERGLQTHVWTVNAEAEMQRLLNIGVAGIMTDRPALLKQVLQQRGEWID